MDPISGNNGVQGQQPQGQGPQGQGSEAQPQYAPPGYGQQPYGQVAPAPRSRRLRWGIAGAVVLCVVLITAGVVFVLSGAGGANSLTASAAPRNAIGFLEVRTDLPGDQHAKLADFMSHFPGFKDRGQFDTALDELLNRLTSAVSPELAYTSALKPWMEGEVSIAVMDIGGIGISTGSSNAPTPVVIWITPSPSGPQVEPTESGSGADSLTDPGYDSVTDYLTYAPPSTVAIFALKDRAAAEVWVASEVTRLGLKTTASDYAGTKLYTTQAGGTEGAYALTDKDLLLGTVGGVKAALDTKTKGSLADNATYQTAMKSLSGDSLARFYVDYQGLLARAMGGLGSAAPTATAAASAIDVPPWIAGSVRAESDCMVMNVAMPRTGSLALGNHVSRLAPFLPGNTVAVIETHSIGKQIAYELTALEAQSIAGMDVVLKAVKDALAQIGGVDWLGDGVAVVTKDGSTFGGGVVVETTDASTASSKYASISNLVTLAGATYLVTSHQESYKGVDITLIDVPASLTGTAIQIAVAAKGNLIVAGYTDAFVKAVIDTTPSTSLASQSDYSTLMGQVGASNEQSFYVNIPALEDEIGRAFFASSPSRWTQDYKPYFDHLGSVAGATIDDSTVTVRLVVT
ncbi:MAG: DUF3352 domain-containing protein, partial [Candidatus Limnocylindrales bacterium]